MPDEEAEELEPKPWCDRCHKVPIGRWYPSYFEDIFLCSDCNDAENELRDKMIDAGIDPSKYEGCGYLPDIKKLRR